VVVSKVGRELYEKFFRGYTRKQWGMDPSELDKSVTARVPTRTNRDDRYFTDEFQFMPAGGYTRMFEKMLQSPNINVMLQTIIVTSSSSFRTGARSSLGRSTSISGSASASCPIARCVSGTRPSTRSSTSRSGP
jgi:UDP-galactopyranose mutase